MTTRSDSGLMQALKAYGRLMRLDRPIGTYLLMWPMLWALWLSSAGKPQEKIFIVFIVFSPWMFMAFRKNTLENVSKKVTDFYDNNFSCNSECKCDTTSTFSNSTFTQLKKDLNTF